MKIRVFILALIFILVAGSGFAQTDSTKFASDSLPKKQVMKKGNTYKLKEQSYYPSLLKRVESELKAQKIQLNEAKKRVKKLESIVEKTEDKLNDVTRKAHEAKMKEKKNKYDYSTARNKRGRFSRQFKDYNKYQDEDVQSLKKELRELRKEIKELKDELKKK